MGLETVISEVEASGAKRAQEILDAARAEADQILATANEAVAKYEAGRQAQAERDAAQILGQGISHAEFEARKLVLTAEAGLRADLRTTVLEGFAALPAATRKGHLEKLAKQAAQVIPSGKVWGAETDKDFLSGLKTHAFAGTTDIAGGLIVENDEGTMRFDLSYETLLDGLWRDILRAEADLFA